MTTQHYIDTADLERKVAELDSARDRLDTLLRQARRALDDARSQNFIIANQIVPADVELSSGPEKPWFEHRDKFATWLAANSRKPWAEWNGCIYRTSELARGEIRQTPVLVTHLPASVETR